MIKKKSLRSYIQELYIKNILIFLQKTNEILYTMSLFTWLLLCYILKIFKISSH